MQAEQREGWREIFVVKGLDGLSPAALRARAAALEALAGELVDLCDAVLCEAEYFGADTDDARESFAWLVADYEAVTGSAPGVSERGPDKGG